MIGTTFANRYRIVRQLGEAGAAGVVWEAVDANQDMAVALKLFGPQTSTIMAYSEAQLLTALEGEHVLRVYNADTHADIPFIATRIARNGSAEDFLKTRAAGIRADSAVSWVRQALIGLGALHARHLLHRDAKPANIFLDSLDRAMIGDFGLAHPLDASGEAPAEGSPFIVSPEMWASGKGTLQSDLYSMGVSLYRLLTGAWPISANSRAALAPLVIRGASQPIRNVAPHVTRKLAARVHKALAIDPRDRFADWREMHEELSRVGVVSRVWEREFHDAGHRACWVEVRQTKPSEHRICVIQQGTSGVTIETRRVTGAKSRVVAACYTKLREARVGVTLRRIFDTL